MNGYIKAIYIASGSGKPMASVASAELVAGRGIAGDRYYSDSGTFSDKLKDLPDKELTLIESEQIEQFNSNREYSLDYGAFRRNIVTQGIQLNDLVGTEFSIGNVRLRGLRLCEPCAHLAKLTIPEILPDMVHKAGLRAAILSSGTISVNEIITL